MKLIKENKNKFYKEKLKENIGKQKELSKALKILLLNYLLPLINLEEAQCAITIKIFSVSFLLNLNFQISLKILY